MSVQAVNGNGYSYKVTTNLSDKQLAENAFLMMSDDDVYKLADNEAKKQIKYKRYRRNSALMLLAWPFVYGLQKAVSARGKSMAEVFPGDAPSLVNRFMNATCVNLKGPAAKMAAGLGTTAKFLGTMGGALALIGGMEAIFNGSDKAREFTKKHNGLVTLIEMTGVVLGITLAPKGLVKLFDKIKPEKLNKMTEKVATWGEKFNNRNLVKNIQGKWHEALTKSPDWLKMTGKYGLIAAPTALGIGILAHWFINASKRNKAFQNNIQAIRAEQTRILNERINNSKNNSYFFMEEISYTSPNKA